MRWKAKWNIVSNATEMISILDCASAIQMPDLGTATQMIYLICFW